MSKIYDKEYGLPWQYLLNRKKRLSEAERRRETFRIEPKGNAFIELNAELERMAKLKKLTTEEYITERFISEFLEEKAKRYASYQKYFERAYANVLVVDEEDSRPIEEHLIGTFGAGEKPVVKKKK